MFYILESDWTEMRACRSGECKGCPVEGTPYTPSGQFRPVTLNSCQCTMSALAARRSAEQRKCKLCFKPIKTDSGFTEDEKVRCELRTVNRFAAWLCVSWRCT